MGKLCSCNFCIKGEDKKEFNGFSGSPINDDDKYIITIWGYGYKFLRANNE